MSAATAAELYADGEGADGETAGGWTLVGDIESHAHYSRQSRWHDRYWLVARNAEGETFGLEYGIGLTENQEDDLPWDRVPGDRERQLTRLYPHTVTRVEYHTTPAREGA
jgi:hypothetical protein